MVTHVSPAAYRGPVGAGETFYVAELDREQQPEERLSGRFGTRAEALPALRWLRQRYPRARLVRELAIPPLEADAKAARNANARVGESLGDVEFALHQERERLRELIARERL